MTKVQVVARMKAHGISGEVSGKGSEWEIEFPTESDMELFAEEITNEFSAFKTGYGSWIARPGAAKTGDPALEEYSYVGCRMHY